MSLSDLGEFGLIDVWQKKLPKFSGFSVGIGDDAAVRTLPNGNLEVWTTDTLVENDHFNRSWSSPEQVGSKAIEVNVSDVAAMGAVPKFVLVNLVLSPEISQEWTERLYDSIGRVCAKYEISVVGGDTTHGALAMISITCVGEIESKNSGNLCLRSDAEVGDLICVTGEVGGSMAGYMGFKNGVLGDGIGHPQGERLWDWCYVLKRHLEPKSRLGASGIIAPLAHAMIDVSDGVASEVKHICRRSSVGAKVFAEKLPIHEEVFAMEENLGKKKFSFALSGGEDFELLFTIAPENAKKLRGKFGDFSVVGEITGNKDQRDLILPNGDIDVLPGGWDHFAG